MDKIKRILSLYERYKGSLQRNSLKIPKEKSEEILNKLHRKISALEKAKAASDGIPVPDRGNYGMRSHSVRTLAVAASVTLLLCGGWWLLKRFEPAERSFEKVYRATDPSLVVRDNRGNSPIPVVLADGSSVLLKPGSELRHPKVFDGRLREVYLSGKAYFEVVKDQSKPFIVKTEGLVTKVLGTSFTIGALAAEATVTVRTGRVVVFTREQFEKTEGSSVGSTDEAMYLVANQRATWDSRKRTLSLSESRSDYPQDRELRILTTFQFRDTPVVDIFRKIEKEYGVEIELDEKVLANCALTTTLKDIPLSEKLRIICEGIGPGTGYSMLEDRIIIRSAGCNK